MSDRVWSLIIPAEYSIPYITMDDFDHKVSQSDTIVGGCRWCRLSRDGCIRSKSSRKDHDWLTSERYRILV
eukprot:COSAG02_NODE_1515_length_12187_cov_37.042025_9_plen_71_part_00